MKKLRSKVRKHIAKKIPHRGLRCAVAIVGAIVLLGAAFMLIRHFSVPLSSSDHIFVVDERWKGKTVHLSEGQLLHVHLHGGNWATVQSSATNVLIRRSTTESSGDGACAGWWQKGAKCGERTDRYEAVGAGEATLSALRAGCADSEARLCKGKRAQFEMKAVVK